MKFLEFIFTRPRYFRDTDKESKPTRMSFTCVLWVKMWQSEEAEKELIWSKSRLCARNHARYAVSIFIHLMYTHNRGKVMVMRLSNKMAYLLEWMKSHLLRSGLLWSVTFPFFLYGFSVSSHPQWLWQDKELQSATTTMTLWWPWPLQILPPL